MVDLDRVVFDCPSFAFWLGNFLFAKSKTEKALKYDVINPAEAKTYFNSLFFLRMSRVSEMKQVDDSVRVLRKWNDMGYDISFVSSRPSFKPFQKAIVVWLEKNGVKFTKLVLGCNNKPEYCSINNFDVIIDDTLLNCKGCAESGMKAIWLRTKYNRNIQTVPKGVCSVNNWKEVYQAVDDFVYQREKGISKLF